MRRPGGGGSIHFQANSGVKSEADIGFSLIPSINPINMGILGGLVIVTLSLATSGFVKAATMEFLQIDNPTTKFYTNNVVLRLPPPSFVP